MEKNWVLIYSTGKAFEAELLKDVLGNNDIISDIINKQDSSYLFGDIEVFVQKENEEKARAIVKDFKA